MNAAPSEHWIFALDHRSGRLVRGHAAQGRAHLAEVGRLVNEWPAHEPHPPSPLAGGGAHAYASLHHETEELRARWAHTAAKWLARKLADGSCEVMVIAPGHLLGALRKAWPSHLARRIREHEAELSALTSSELARHPAVAHLLVEPTHA